ncbi:MAG: glycine cleavage system protein GcvH [Candidatus Kapabacteria bacterium]|nr:glycine cleavage system protein GcvH [Candidatus Kapabacteria bacterium]
MEFPKDLKYTSDHEWIKVDGNIGTIGITAHAASELGDVVYVDVAEDLSELVAGENFGTIEAVKTVADLLAPVTGKVTAVNTALNDAPETVNNDPYGDGWMVKVEIANLSELNGLMDAKAYEEFIGA